MTDKKPDNFPEFAWTAKTMRKCPFCSFNKTYCKLEWEERIFDENKRHMIVATVRCHKCGANVSYMNSDPKYAADGAFNKWQHRAGDDE